MNNSFINNGGVAGGVKTSTTSDKLQSSTMRTKELVRRKEEEISELYGRQLDELEVLLREKSAEGEKLMEQLVALRGSFSRLQQDFQYNLNLLRGRDEELARYDTKIAAIDVEMEEHGMVRKTLEDKVGRLETRLHAENSRRVEEAKQYESRLGEVRGVIEGARKEYEADLKRRRSEVERQLFGMEQNFTEKERKNETKVTEMKQHYERELEEKSRLLEQQRKENAKQFRLLEEETQFARNQLVRLKNDQDSLREIGQQHEEQLVARQAKEVTLKKALEEAREASAIEVRRLIENHANAIRAMGEEAEREKQCEIRDLQRRHEDAVRSVREEALKQRAELTNMVGENGDSIRAKWKTEVDELRSQFDAQLKEKDNREVLLLREVDAARQAAKSKEADAQALLSRLASLEQNVIPALKDDISVASVELMRLREQLETAREDATIRRREILQLQQQTQASLAEDAVRRQNDQLCKQNENLKRALLMKEQEGPREEEVTVRRQNEQTLVGGATFEDNNNTNPFQPLFPGDLGPISPLMTMDSLATSLPPATTNKSRPSTPISSIRNNCGGNINTNEDDDLEAQNARLRAVIMRMREEAENTNQSLAGGGGGERNITDPTAAAASQQQQHHLQRRVSNLTQHIAQLQDERVELMDLSNQLRRELVRRKTASSPRSTTSCSLVAIPNSSNNNNACSSKDNNSNNRDVSPISNNNQSSGTTPLRPRAPPDIEPSLLVKYHLATPPQRSVVANNRVKIAAELRNPSPPRAKPLDGAGALVVEGYGANSHTTTACRRI